MAYNSNIQLREYTLTINILPDLNLGYSQRCSQHCSCEVTATSPKCCDGSCESPTRHGSLFKGCCLSYQLLPLWLNHLSILQNSAFTRWVLWLFPDHPWHT